MVLSFLVLIFKLAVNMHFSCSSIEFILLCGKVKVHFIVPVGKYVARQWRWGNLSTVFVDCRTGQESLAGGWLVLVHSVGSALTQYLSFNKSESAMFNVAVPSPNPIPLPNLNLNLNICPILCQFLLYYNRILAKNIARYCCHDISSVLWDFFSWSYYRRRPGGLAYSALFSTTHEQSISKVQHSIKNNNVCLC